MIWGYHYFRKHPCLSTSLSLSLSLYLLVPLYLSIYLYLSFYLAIYLASLVWGRSHNITPQRLCWFEHGICETRETKGSIPQCLSKVMSNDVIQNSGENFFETHDNVFRFSLTCIYVRLHNNLSVMGGVNLWENSPICSTRHLTRIYQHIQERCSCEFPHGIPPTENNPGFPAWWSVFRCYETQRFCVTPQHLQGGPGSSHKWGYGVPINP